MATTTKATTKKPAAPAKAAVKKPAKAEQGPKVAAKKPAAKKPAKALTTQRHPVKQEQRRNYIEVAAYFIAERHGFTPGRQLADWASAEAEIDRLLEAGLLNP